MRPLVSLRLYSPDRTAALLTAAETAALLGPVEADDRYGETPQRVTRSVQFAPGVAHLATKRVTLRGEREDGEVEWWRLRAVTESVGDSALEVVARWEPLWRDAYSVTARLADAPDGSLALFLTDRTPADALAELFDPANAAPTADGSADGPPIFVVGAVPASMADRRVEVSGEAGSVLDYVRAAAASVGADLRFRIVPNGADPSSEPYTIDLVEPPADDEATVLDVDLRDGASNAVRASREADDADALSAVLPLAQGDGLTGTLAGNRFVVLTDIDATALGYPDARALTLSPRRYHTGDPVASQVVWEDGALVGHRLTAFSSNEAVDGRPYVVVASFAPDTVVVDPYDDGGGARPAGPYEIDSLRVLSPTGGPLVALMSPSLYAELGRIERAVTFDVHPYANLLEQRGRLGDSEGVSANMSAWDDTPDGPFDVAGPYGVRRSPRLGGGMATLTKEQSAGYVRYGTASLRVDAPTEGYGVYVRMEGYGGDLGAWAALRVDSGSVAMRLVYFAEGEDSLSSNGALIDSSTASAPGGADEGDALSVWSELAIAKSADYLPEAARTGAGHFELQFRPTGGPAVFVLDAVTVVGYPVAVPYRPDMGPEALMAAAAADLGRRARQGTETYEVDLLQMPGADGLRVGDPVRLRLRLAGGETDRDVRVLSLAYTEGVGQAAIEKRATLGRALPTLRDLLGGTSAVGGSATATASGAGASGAAGSGVPLTRTVELTVGNGLTVAPAGPQPLSHDVEIGLGLDTGYLDGRYLNTAAALADLDAGTARSNLSVYSQAEADGRFANVSGDTFTGAVTFEADVRLGAGTAGGTLKPESDRIAFYGHTGTNDGHVYVAKLTVGEIDLLPGGNVNTISGDETNVNDLWLTLNVPDSGSPSSSNGGLRFTDSDGSERHLIEYDQGLELPGWRHSAGEAFRPYGLRYAGLQAGLDSEYLGGQGADYYAALSEDETVSGSWTHTAPVTVDAGAGVALSIESTNEDVDVRMGQAGFGFALRYTGTEGGVNNALEVWADNQGGAPVRATRTNQAGQMTVYLPLTLGTQATTTAHAVRADRAITTSPATGLDGGGNLTADRALALAGQALALHQFSGVGMMARLGPSSFQARSLVAPAYGIAVANEDGVAGNPTLSLSDDLLGLESLSSVGFAVRTGASTWQNRSLTVGALMGLSIQNGSGVGGNVVLEGPQNLRTSADPTFHDLQLTGSLDAAYNIIAGGWIDVSGYAGIGGDLSVVGYSTLGDGLEVFGGSDLYGTTSLRGGTLTYDTISSAVWTSGFTGWGVTPAGNADFRSVYADEIRTQAFIAEVAQALAGEDVVGKSVGVLASDFVVPAAGGTATLHVEDLPGLPNMGVFQPGDLVRLRIVARLSSAGTASGSIADDVWGTVSAYVDGADNTQTWTFTRSTGDALDVGSTVYAGSVAVDYGEEGDALIWTTVLDPVAAGYQQMVRWYDDDADGVPDRYDVAYRLGDRVGISRPGIGALSGPGLFSESLALYGDADHYLLFEPGAGFDLVLGGTSVSAATGQVAAVVSQSQATSDALAALTITVGQHTSEIAQRVTVTTYDAGIAAEQAARAAAVQAEADARVAAINAEATARGTALTAEENARIAAIQQEASDRAAAIAAEATARDAAITTAVAGVTSYANSTFATVASFAAFQSATGTSISALEQTVSAHGSTLVGIASWQSSTDASLGAAQTSITSIFDDLGAVNSTLTSYGTTLGLHGGRLTTNETAISGHTTTLGEHDDHLDSLEERARLDISWFARRPLAYYPFRGSLRDAITGAEATATHTELRAEGGRYGEGYLPVSIARTNRVTAYARVGSGNQPWDSDASDEVFTILPDAPSYTGKNGTISFVYTAGSPNVYLSGSSDLDYGSPSSDNWTFSVYIRRADGQPMPATINVYIYTSAGNTTAAGTVTDVGGGWYRVVRTRSGTDLGHPTVVGLTGLLPGVTYLLDGWQVESTPYVTSYADGQAVAGTLSIPSAVQAGQGSIAFWVRQPPPDSSGNRAIFDFRSSGSRNDLWTSDDDTGGLYWIAQTAGANGMTARPSSTLGGDWILAVLTWDGATGQRTLYAYNPRTGTEAYNSTGTGAAALNWGPTISAGLSGGYKSHVEYEQLVVLDYVLSQAESRELATSAGPLSAVTESGYAGFVADVTENYARIASLASYEVQTAGGSPVARTLAGWMGYVDAHDASLSALATWQGTTNTAISGLQATASAQAATISTLATIAYVDTATTTLSTSLAGTQATVTGHTATLSNIASWQSGIDSSIATIEQDVSAAEAAIALRATISALDAETSSRTSADAGLDARVTANEAAFSNYATITALNTATNTVNTTISGIDGRVTAAEGTLDSHVSILSANGLTGATNITQRVTTAETNIGLRATTTYVDGLVAGSTSERLRAWGKAVDWRPYVGVGLPAGWSDPIPELSNIVQDAGPSGALEAVWESVAASGNLHDGGPQTVTYLDPGAYGYRYSLWYRRTDAPGRRIYMGAATGGTHVKTLDGDPASNPYFVAGPYLDVIGVGVGEWVLLVGMLHPRGYTGASSDISGVYRRDGEQIWTGLDHVVSETASAILLRAFQYLAADGATGQFARPRIDRLDGTEPTLAALLGASPEQAGAIAALDLRTGEAEASIESYATILTNNGLTSGTTITQRVADAEASILLRATTTYVDQQTGDINTVVGGINTRLGEAEGTLDSHVSILSANGLSVGTNITQRVSGAESAILLRATQVSLDMTNQNVATVTATATNLGSRVVLGVDGSGNVATLDMGAGTYGSAITLSADQIDVEGLTRFVGSAAGLSLAWFDSAPLGYWPLRTHAYDAITGAAATTSGTTYLPGGGQTGGGALSVDLARTNRVKAYARVGSGNQPWGSDASDEVFTILPGAPSYTGKGGTISFVYTAGSPNIYLNGSGDVDYGSPSSDNWTFSIYIRRTDGQPMPATINVYIYTSAGTSTAAGTVTDVGGGWYRVVRTRSGTDLGYPTLVGLTGLLPGVTYLLDGWQVESTPYATAYADGAAGAGSFEMPSPVSHARGTILLWVTAPPSTAGGNTGVIDFTGDRAQGAWRNDMSITSGRPYWIVEKTDGSGDAHIQVPAFSQSTYGERLCVMATWDASTGARTLSAYSPRLGETRTISGTAGNLLNWGSEFWSGYRKGYISHVEYEQLVVLDYAMDADAFAAYAQSTAPLRESAEQTVVDGSRIYVGNQILLDGTTGKIRTTLLDVDTIVSGLVTDSELSAVSQSVTNLSNSLGTLATLNNVEFNLLGSTVVEQGYIRTDLIDAQGMRVAVLAAGLISASDINASSIRTAVLTADSVTATQIAAGAVTASEIAAGSITATHIQSASITGDRIAAGTITGSNILAGSITATQINVSSLFATDIAVSAALTAYGVKVGLFDGYLAGIQMPVASGDYWYWDDYDGRVNLRMGGATGITYQQGAPVSIGSNVVVEGDVQATGRLVAGTVGGGHTWAELGTLTGGGQGLAVRENYDDRVRVGAFTIAEPSVTPTNVTATYIPASDFSSLTGWTTDDQDGDSTIAGGVLTLATTGSQQQARTYRTVALGSTNDLRGKTVIVSIRYRTDQAWGTNGGSMIRAYTNAVDLIDFKVPTADYPTWRTLEMPVNVPAGSTHLTIDFTNVGLNAAGGGMEVDWVKLELYSKVYSQLAPDGLLVYNSPQNYLDFRIGKLEAAVTQLLANHVGLRTGAGAPEASTNEGRLYWGDSGLCVMGPDGTAYRVTVTPT